TTPSHITARDHFMSQSGWISSNAAVRVTVGRNRHLVTSSFEAAYKPRKLSLHGLLHETNLSATQPGRSVTCPKRPIYRVRFYISDGLSRWAGAISPPGGV